MTDLGLEVYNPVESGIMVREKALKTIEDIMAQEPPTFTRAFDEFDRLKETAAKFQDVKNVIVVGNGGSITSFAAYYDALVRYNTNDPKNAFILNNMEPDVISHIKKTYPTSNSLVIPISKSGNTVGVLESLLALSDYPVLAITTKGDGALWRITQEKDWPYLLIPDDIGGRFSGRTFTGYFPAYLTGVDVEGIEQGAKEVCDFYLNNIDLEVNLPLQLAYHHYLLEHDKRCQMYLSIYSQRLYGFYPLMVQLIHETFGKEGKGVTVYGGQGPEAQHHTNQRFFGGRQDTHGLFLTVDKQESQQEVTVPGELKALKLGSAEMGILDGIALDQSMRFESQGVLDAARDQNIPFAHLTVDKITPYSVGEIMVFFHFYVYYSAVFRGVNPFDQPAVEDSKKRSFEMRKSG
jgi:glucose-6-phosphate isomerase